jgi:hypothetical protein
VANGAFRTKIDANLAQGRAFAERFARELPEDLRQSVDSFAGLGDQGWLARRGRVLRHGFWKIGFLRNLGWLAKV